MKRNWTVYLIHHSHTDIGYTERQDKIATYHRDFICQAVDILDEIHNGTGKEAQGFKWQCENFWQVRNFYASASDSYIERFEKYVQGGEIGLSGNYLNLTELVSYDVLFERIGLAKEYGRKIGYPVRSAMCADINGMAWGYADALAENEIQHLYTCIHPHHGMFPLGKKLQPFYWESPKNNRVLVWNGDYYHLGNEMFFAPRAGNTYLIRDEYHEPMNQHMILNRREIETEKLEWEILQTRLERYLSALEEENYPVSFVPFMVSGCITDNAPPSAALAERVNRLNEVYKGCIHFEMATLDTFFNKVKEEYHSIPCYSGDFNDWWADGIGSTPAAVRIYLDARRKNSLVHKLDPSGGNQALKEETVENLMLYSEHTWGYSSSVIEPWEPLVGNLEWKKAGYAVNADTAAAKNLDLLLEKKGEISICHEKGQYYRIVNPHKIAVQLPVYLYIELWEYVDGRRFFSDIPVKVIDSMTGSEIPSQVSTTARAFQIEIVPYLEPGEEKVVQIIPTEKPPVTICNLAWDGAEGIPDLLRVKRKDTSCIETERLRVEMKQCHGIISIYDKKLDYQMLRQNSVVPAFSGVYEVTEGPEDARIIRRNMGRNRKMSRTKRFFSKLTDIRIVEEGDIYTAVVLDYELEGCNMYQVYLKIYESNPMIEARVRIHKQSIWNPENLYISLPFTAGEEETAWIDKTGCIFRPGIDQIPGTNQEFYLVQNGIVWECGEHTAIVSTKDAPLVTFGGIESGPIRLCNGNDLEKNHSDAYSWVMNNYWETNFKAETGGFHEFTYRIQSGWGKSMKESFALCEAANEGVLGFYIRNKEKRNK